MATPPRVAYSPGEFAKMFGKSQTWGYRQIYAGKVTTITDHGRILIPAKDVERILESAGIYNGREKPKAAQKRVAKLAPEQRDIWRRFLELRRQPEPGRQAKRHARHLPNLASNGKSRASVMAQLKKSWARGRQRA